MSFFIQSLYVVIPIFVFLIIIEEIISRYTGKKINRAMDVISSLGSGITNITKDGMKFSIVLVSYSFFLEHLELYKLEPLWASIFLAILVGKLYLSLLDIVCE